jgi:hypothetical protein
LRGETIAEGVAPIVGTVRPPVATTSELRARHRAACRRASRAPRVTPSTARLAPLDAAAVALRCAASHDIERGLSQNSWPSFFSCQRMPWRSTSARIARPVAGERRATEIRVLRQVAGRSRAGIGEVAAAAARDADLLADAMVVLDQQHAPSALPGGRRARHAGGAGADHDDVVIRVQGAADRSDPADALARNVATAALIDGAMRASIFGHRDHSRSSASIPARLARGAPRRRARVTSRRIP